jgi:hypothetical protein
MGFHPAVYIKPILSENEADPILEMRSDRTIPVYCHSRSFNVIIDLDYWQNKNPVFPEDVLIWFTDGSRADSGTGAGIFGLRPNCGLCFSFGKYATVFQTEILHYCTNNVACVHIVKHLACIL